MNDEEKTKYYAEKQEANDKWQREHDKWVWWNETLPGLIFSCLVVAFIIFAAVQCGKQASEERRIESEKRDRMIRIEAALERIASKIPTPAVN